VYQPEIQRVATIQRGATPIKFDDVPATHKAAVATAWRDLGVHGRTYDEAVCAGDIKVIQHKCTPSILLIAFSLVAHSDVLWRS
jgi:hypothetical protein